VKKEFVMSDEVLDKAKLALLKNENWMAYNNSLYFIESDDVNFFKTEEQLQDYGYIQ
jgi:hypothetical protein